jgi:hypothetical protein
MRELFYRSFDVFLVRERNNILNDVSERNLCQRLGFYLEDERKAAGLDGYFVDAEYNRQQNGHIKTIIDDEAREISITCDLILHSRGEMIQHDNLIAIEMKKSDRPARDKQNDRIRLRALTKPSYDGVWVNDGTGLPKYVCGYDLGLYIELDVGNGGVTVEEFERGEPVGRRVYRLAEAAA